MARNKTPHNGGRPRTKEKKNRRLALQKPRVFTVSSQALAACPAMNLSPSHWRIDGTCHHQKATA